MEANCPYKLKQNEHAYGVSVLSLPHASKLQQNLALIFGRDQPKAFIWDGLMTDQFDDKASRIKEVLNELFSLLEDLETRNEAIQEFLKAEGIATDEKLKPHFDQAGNAASVRWRAARVRMEHLFSPVPAAVRDREPAKPAPKEKEGPDKPTGAKEKSETTANPDETTAQPIVENSAPAPDKAAAHTKDLSPNQQLSKAPNVDQQKAAD
jgi:hypothetical protein